MYLNCIHKHAEPQSERRERGYLYGRNEAKAVLNASRHIVSASKASTRLEAQGKINMLAQYQTQFTVVGYAGIWLYRVRPDSPLLISLSRDCSFSSSISLLCRFELAVCSEPARRTLVRLQVRGHSRQLWSTHDSSRRLDAPQSDNVLCPAAKDLEYQTNIVVLRKFSF
jgi:hypothetical protein